MHDLLAQIRTLSSGTLATLSGLVRYDELDAVREVWLDWARSHEISCVDWQDSWRAFSEEHAFVKYAGNVTV